MDVVATVVGHSLLMIAGACLWHFGRDKLSPKPRTRRGNDAEHGTVYATSRGDDGSQIVARRLQEEVCDLQQALMEAEEEVVTLKGQTDKQEVTLKGQTDKHKVTLKARESSWGPPRDKQLPVPNSEAAIESYQQQVCCLQQEIFESRRACDKLRLENSKLKDKSVNDSNVAEMRALLNLYKNSINEHETIAEQIQTENDEMAAQLTQQNIRRRTPKVPSDYPKLNPSQQASCSSPSRKATGLSRSASATSITTSGRSSVPTSPNPAVTIRSTNPSDLSPTSPTYRIKIGKKVVVARDLSKSDKLAKEISSLQVLQERLDRLEAET